MLENTERATKDGQSRETGNIGYTKHKEKTNQRQHNVCWTPLIHKQAQIT